MIRSFIVILTFCTLLTGCTKPSLDAMEIQCTFDAYKSAILSMDGSASVDQIAQRTLNEYQKYIDWCLHADRRTLQNLSTINKMQVFLIKHRIPVDELKEMTGEKAFIYAVDHDWIGKKGTIVTTINDIQVSGSRATTATLSNKKKTPMRFHFTKEEGAWKLDLTQTLRDTDAVLKAQIEQAGISEDDYIFRIIEMISGRKVLNSIWEPIETK